MIEKARLSVEDIRSIPVGAEMKWQLENGAAVISARNLVTYVQRYDGMRFTTKADFVNSCLKIERIS